MLIDLPPITIDVHPLAYEERLDERPLDAITGIVIHCTELPDMISAREHGERIQYAGSQTGNSGHFYIDRDGRIERFIAPDRIAHHVRGFNPETIGIELVNLGRYPRWYDSDHQTMQEPYPPAQISALIELIQSLREQLPQLQWIAGHEDLDQSRVTATDDAGRQVARKLDPGPHFPWSQLLESVPLARRQSP